MGKKSLGSIVRNIGKAAVSDTKAAGKGIGNFFVSIGKFFQEAAKGFVKGDIFVKCSLVIMGAGYLRRKQIVKGLLITAYQAVAIWFLSTVGAEYLPKLSTLGTVVRKTVFNEVTMKNEVNDFDHSFKILLFGIISVVVMIVFILTIINNLRVVYELQKMDQRGEHITTFREEIKMYRNEKFYVTLLTLPCLGIIAFTVIPLFVMIAVAFTNYDQANMPPTSLFTWVGLSNFKALFTTSITSTFGYSFWVVFKWTMTWAFFATFTTYFGGIFMAMFINSKKTIFPKFWRTLFIITIAVPQFVSLLVVRNLFADTGIINSICANWGITELLRDIGLINPSLTYVPFLTDPTWAHVTIIVINIWIGVPYLMLIATGILMNIPTELMEAARIDGANGFQIFMKITMPYMLFVTGPYLVTSFVQNINNFNVIYLLSEEVFYTLDQKLANSYAREVDLLITWLYKLTQDRYNYKMASTIGILVFLICAAFTLIIFNRMIKGDREEAFQ